jgi:hypothetical protein
MQLMLSHRCKLMAVLRAEALLPVRCALEQLAFPQGSLDIFCKDLM